MISTVIWFQVFLSNTNNLYTIICFQEFQAITEPLAIMSRVFANGLVDQGSIPGQVIPKTQKMVLNATLLNTQYHKVRIKGKVEQPRE